MFTKLDCSEKSEPKVSIVCCTYNQEKYIYRALEGFLMQKTSFDIEIIVHDDCSTDDTVSIIQAFQASYPDKITLIIPEENLYSSVGCNAPLENAIKYTSGSFIALCEGDDYWCDEFKVQKQYDALEKSDCAICFTKSYEINCETGNKLIVNNHGDSTKIIPAHRIISMRGESMTTASIMFRREYYSELKSVLDISPIGDFFMQSYFSSINGALYLPDITAVYRRFAVGSWTLTQMNDPKYVESYCKGMLLGLEEMSSLFSKDDVLGSINIVYKHYFRMYLVNFYMNWRVVGFDLYILKLLSNFGIKLIKGMLRFKSTPV